MPETHDLLERAARGFVPDPAALDGTVRRVRRRAVRRRVGAAVVGVTVAVAAGFLLVRSFDPAEVPAIPEPSPSPTPTTEAAAWTTCTNEVVGYTIEHPREWFTTDVPAIERGGGASEAVPEVACRYFGPEPYTLVAQGDRREPFPEGDPHPAIHVVLDERSFAEVRQSYHDPDSEVQADTEEEVTIDGRRGVLIQAGYECCWWDLYLVDLGPDGTLWIQLMRRASFDRSFATAYERNREVLDRMVQSFRLVEPDP